MLKKSPESYHAAEFLKINKDGTKDIHLNEDGAKHLYRHLRSKIRKRLSELSTVSKPCGAIHLLVHTQLFPQVLFIGMGSYDFC